MRRRPSRALFVLTLPTLALAAVSGDPQARPATSTTGSSAGTTGGVSPGGWAIQTNPSGSSSASNVASMPWGQPGAPSGTWANTASNGGSISVGTTTSTSVSAQSSGSVGVRFTWMGSNQPAVSWVMVSASSSWHGDNASGSAADGFGDPLRNSADGTGGISSGARVYRVTSPSVTSPSLTVTVSGLSASASASPSTDSTTYASAGCAVTGSLTDKNASLSRSDGGGFNAQTKDAVYVADTLLS